jgi:hypothetical protein
MQQKVECLALLKRRDICDAELISGTEIVSIEDPFTKELIKIPVAGNTCKHRSCFDYETFVASGIQKCPICRTEIKLENLQVDQQLYEFLLRNEATQTVTFNAVRI